MQINVGNGEPGGFGQGPVQSPIEKIDESPFIASCTSFDLIDVMKMDPKQRRS
jgi:hypothetical protein